ncbi:MAG: hypothetical protein QXI60_04855 [Thermofilaceae archaeon]
MSRDETSRVRRYFDEHSEEYFEKYFDSATALYRKKNAFLKRFVQYEPNNLLKVLDMNLSQNS